MGRKKQLNVVQCGAQYADGESGSSEHSLPPTEPVLESQALEDDGIQVEQQADDLLNMTGDDEEVKKRGGTALPHVWNLPAGKRIVVKCNKLGQPIGMEGGVLSQFLGTLARNGGYCPLYIEDWRKLKEDGGDLTILQCVETKFMYPRTCDKWILKTTGRDWRRYKATLKKKLFNPKKKRSFLYRLCPDDVDEDQWVALVNYWKSKKGKALSEKNKQSRAMLRNPHSAGTKSYARWAEDLRQDDPEKKQPHRANVYLATHKRKMGKDKDEQVAALENLIDEQPMLAQNDQGKVAWKGDALHQVLGEEKPGQVHGMGLLPVPKKVYGHIPHQLKNINITTIDSSSSEDGMHVVEEVEELREQVKKQGLLIQELLNKQASLGNKEPVALNFQTTNLDNVQQEAVHSKRKRVQCDVPDLENSMSGQRDTLMNKERYMGQQIIHEDNHLLFSSKKLPCQERSSSPPCIAPDLRQEEFDMQRTNSIEGRKMMLAQMNKKRQNLQETINSTQQQGTQKKTPQNKSSKQMQPSLMKAGTVVILKTATYPNKECVAYATFFSNDPHAIVDDVEIGNQFMKVVINYPVVEKEELVRPIKRCKTIGDAHVEGKPIAWPSFCVEKINV